MTATKTFPLKTVLVTIKCVELGRRVVESPGVTVGDALELMRHVMPGTPTPPDAASFIHYHLAPMLAKHFPQLAAVSVDKVTQSNFQEWMRVMKTEFGETIEVAPFAETD